MVSTPTTDSLLFNFDTTMNNYFNPFPSPKSEKQNQETNEQEKKTNSFYTSQNWADNRFITFPRHALQPSLISALRPVASDISLSNSFFDTSRFLNQDHFGDFQEFAQFDVKGDSSLEQIPYNANLCAPNPQQKLFDDSFHQQLAKMAPSLNRSRETTATSRTNKADNEFRKEVSERFLNLVNESDLVAVDNLEDAFKCPVKGCNRAFSVQWALEEHELKHQQDDKTREFKCPECEKGFFTKSCLKSHLKIHTRKPNGYSCEYSGCEKQYSTSEGLRLHIRNHHLVDKRWVCPVDECSKRFVRQSDMRLHIMRIHAKTRPHPCRFEGCSKSFACFSELRRHEASHQRRVKKNSALAKRRGGM